MSDVELTIACGDYDRTRPLIIGHIVPNGLKLAWSSPPIEETIAGMLREEAFDIAEMSLAATAIAVNRGRPALVALPVFPSRFFRHSSVFVHSGSGITSLRHLAGRKVGMFNYHRMAAAVWFRGLLLSDYGIEPHEIDWYVTDSPPYGERDRIRVDPPAKVRITSIGGDMSLDSMLEAGEIDALLAVRIPEPYRQGSPNVRRLLDDPIEIELDYFQRTGIFPIMHTLVVRRAVFEEHPWIGNSLCEAFETARLQAQRTSDDIGEARHSLAWWLLYRERERELLGDAWAYGVAPNHRTLSVFLRYCFEQGLTDHRMEPQELFEECPWSPAAE
jgi:4,5-dihydroxyphthalate decarboxylase